MANYLDANPRVAASVAEWLAWRDHGKVPFTHEGELFGWIAGKHVATVAPAAPLAVQDYVVGLELLGVRFSVTQDRKGKEVLHQQSPTSLPSSWDDHAVRITRAFGNDRAGEVIAFIRERDGLS